MAYEQKPNTGSLFVNDKKEKETHADYTGSITLDDGKSYFLNGWKKPGKDGKKGWLSLSLKPKTGGRQQTVPNKSFDDSEPDPF